MLEVLKNAKRRFDRDDLLPKINISKDKIKEIVKNAALRIDPGFESQPDASRILNHAATEIIKTLLPHAEGPLTEEENSAIEDYKKNTNHIIFLGKVFYSNFLLLKLEGQVALILHKRRREERRLRLQEEHKRMLVIAFSAQEDYDREVDRQEQIYKDLANQAYLHYQRILELMKHQNTLKAQIIENEKVIRESRKVHYKHALQFVNDVKVGNVATFEGMSDKQREIFFHHAFAIEEMYARLIEELERELEIRSRNHFGVEDVYKKVMADEAWKKERIRVLMNKRINAYTRLGDHAGCLYINSKVLDSVFIDHHKAFTEHKEIKVDIQQHQGVTRDRAKDSHVCKVGIEANAKQIQGEFEQYEVKENDSLHQLAEYGHKQAEYGLKKAEYGHGQREFLQEASAIESKSEYISSKSQDSEPLSFSEVKGEMAELKGLLSSKKFGVDDGYLSVDLSRLEVKVETMDDYGLKDIGKGIPDLSQFEDLDDLDFEKLSEELLGPHSEPSKPSL